MLSYCSLDSMDDIPQNVLDDEELLIPEGFNSRTCQQKSTSIKAQLLKPCKQFLSDVPIDELEGLDLKTFTTRMKIQLLNQNIPGEAEPRRRLGESFRLKKIQEGLRIQATFFLEYKMPPSTYFLRHYLAKTDTKYKPGLY